MNSYILVEENFNKLRHVKELEETIEFYKIKLCLLLIINILLILSLLMFIGVCL